MERSTQVPLFQEKITQDQNIFLNDTICYGPCAFWAKEIMNNVDYTKNLNRTNEIFQKKLRENRDSHDENLQSVKEASAKRIQDQAESYRKDKARMEKNLQDTVANLRSTQEDELQRKSKQYEQTVEKNKNQFHDLRQKQLKEWTNKFGDLQKSYNESLSRNEEGNKIAKAEMARNYKENLNNVRNKSEEDIKRFIDNTNKKSGDSSQSYVDQINDLQKLRADEKSALVQENLRKENKFRKDVSNSISKMQKAQQEEFIAGRDMRKATFSKLNDDWNARRAKFEAERIDTQAAKNLAENKRNNDMYQEKVSQLRKKYDGDLRRRDNAARAEKISRGEINKQIQDEMRANDKQILAQQKEAIVADKNKTVKRYQTMIQDQEAANQDAFKKSKLDFAEKEATNKLKLTEEARQKELQNKLNQATVANNHRIELEYSEDRAKDRLDTAKKNSDTKIKNLKEEFNRGMELATFKARRDFEKNREETVKEKAELQKRLHEANSKTNTYLKKVYSEKLERMELGYEKRIMELENQNKLIQQNANDKVLDISRQTQREIDRQRAIAEKSAKDQIAAERKMSAEKDKQYRENLNKLQATFSARINEQSATAAKRLKRTIAEMENTRKEEAIKYQDIIDTNNKLFQREMARVVASSDAEREGLISQYEDRIKQLQKLHADKIEEMKEFDRMSANA